MKLSFTQKIKSLLKTFLPQAQSNKSIALNVCYFFILVLFFFLFTPSGVFDEINSLTTDNVNIAKLAANVIYFVVAIIVSVCTLFFIFTSKHKVFRLLFWVLFIFYASDLTYLYLTGTYVSVSEFVFMYKEIHLIGDAISNYIMYIALVSISVLLVIVVSELFINKRIKNSIPKTVLALAVFISFALIYASLQLSGGRRDKYAAQFRIPDIVAFSFLNKYKPEVGLNLKYGQRMEAAKPAYDSAADYILLIVDESIVSYSLGLNGSKFDSTPELAKIPPGKLINLGTASSTANSSASSNYILRNNLQVSQLPDASQGTLLLPSLFSYAKQAGYATYLIDAQAQPNLLQNYLSKYDMEVIDTYMSIQAKDKRYTNDYTTIDFLKKEMSDKAGKKFFFIVKQGLHFPYNSRYPEEFEKFQPAFKSDEFISYEATEQQRLINTYLNAILWNVDNYLGYLLTELEPFMDKAAIIYTSDHGQSIADPGTSRPHGSPVNPPMAQASVPLMLMGKTFSAQSALFEKDCYSAFQIGPTILELLGYDAKAYGQSLFSGCPQKREIFAGSNPFNPNANKYEFTPDAAARNTWLP